MELSGEALEDIYRAYKNWLKDRPYDRTLVIPILNEGSKVSQLIIRK